LRAVPENVVEEIGEGLKGGQHSYFSTSMLRRAEKGGDYFYKVFPRVESHIPSVRVSGRATEAILEAVSRNTC